MPARSSASERLQCPIGLVPFETEGPNKPIALPCSHNVSEEQFKLVRPPQPCISTSMYHLGTGS